MPDLGGEEIEPYANALFRYWKLGQAQKNNGVLFLIAPKQRRMRIEVGYGLEGVLTDVTSKIIIANAATPRFKAGDYDGGVSRAVDDVVIALTTDKSDWTPELKAKSDASDGDSVIPFIIIFFIILFFIWRLNRRGQRTGGAWIVPFNTGGWSSGGGGGGSSDGGFSGGGGSSGGGGASGGW